MTRRARLIAFSLLTAVVLSAGACTNLTGPRGDCAPTDAQGSNTC